MTITPGEKQKADRKLPPAGAIGIWPGLWLYNLVTAVGSAVLLFFAAPLMLTEKRRKTLRHRLGWISPLARRQLGHFGRAAHRPIWIHALSVGEIVSAVSLVDRIGKRFPSVPIVFSVSTKTGHDVAVERIQPLGAAVVYFPYDILLSVMQSIRRINPCAVVMVETDLWPNFIFQIHRRRIPLILVNGRVSDKSFNGYRRFSFFFKSMFAAFTCVCVPTAADAARFKQLGVPPKRLFVTGNVKCDRAGFAADKPHLAGFDRWEGKTVVVAGSTHNGEETMLCDSMQKLKKAGQPVAVIVVPRNPLRAGAVCRLFRRSGFSAVLYTDAQHGEIDKKTEVVVIGAIGMLEALYHAADIAFVGGSLVDRGGHNPLEPAAHAKPVVFGPFMDDFLDIAQQLTAWGGAVQVQDADGLFHALFSLVASREKAQDMGTAAQKVLEANQGALARVMDIVASAVPLPKPNGDAHAASKNTSRQG